MLTLEESFDGTFADNIKSTNYKSQFATKKHKIVINVSGTVYFIQKPNMQSLNMLLKRTNGSSIQTPSPLSTSTFAGSTELHDPISLLK
jgi:hypothetical protein